MAIKHIDGKRENNEKCTAQQLFTVFLLSKSNNVVRLGFQKTQVVEFKLCLFSTRFIAIKYLGGKEKLLKIVLRNQFLPSFLSKIENVSRSGLQKTQTVIEKTLLSNWVWVEPAYSFRVPFNCPEHEKMEKKKKTRFYSLSKACLYFLSKVENIDCIKWDVFWTGRKCLILQFGTIGNANTNGHVEHKMKKKFSLLEKTSFSRKFNFCRISFGKVKTPLLSSQQLFLIY